MMPKVSIVIACYNQGADLIKMLDGLNFSLLDDVELVLVNNGSEDEETIRVFDSLKNKGFTFIHQQKNNLATVWNKGIEKAKGTYILPAEAGALINVDFIDAAVRVLDQQPEVGIVYCSAQKINLEQTAAELVLVNFIQTALYRKDVWIRNKGYDTAFSCRGFETWDFWLTALEQRQKIHGFQESRCMQEPSFNLRGSLNTLEYKEVLSTNIVRLIAKHKDLYTSSYEQALASLMERLMIVQASHDVSVKETLRETNALLLSSVSKLRIRIQEMENSRFWRMRKIYYKAFEVFKSSRSAAKDNKTLLGPIPYFLFHTGKQSVVKFFKLIFQELWGGEDKSKEEKFSSSPKYSLDPYQQWRNNHAPRASDLKEYKRTQAVFQVKPLITLLLPIRNPRIVFWEETMHSIMNQVYEHWELCIVHEQTDEEFAKKIKEYAAKDARIKILSGISDDKIPVYLNAALESSSGEYVVFVEQEDLLAEEALYELVKELNVRPSDMIYSDHDKVTDQGAYTDPHFKPDWCPDNFLSRNYIQYLICIRKQVLQQANGIRTGFEGAELYDLLLRVTEIASAVVRIPKVLYHVRKDKAPFYGTTIQELESSVKAISEALKRRKEKAEVQSNQGIPGCYAVRFPVQSEGKVSIVIPTKNNAKVLRTCLESLFDITSYKNFEVILIDNNSDEQSLFDLLKEFQQKEPERFKSFKYDIPFNFSKLMNYAVDRSEGNYILLLNNDTEIIHEDWLTGMVEYAQRKSIGCVGVKLLYPNDTIQHAGVLIGGGNLSTHAFVGSDKEALGYDHYLASVSNYSAVTAACMMCRIEVYKEVGGFDEAYAVNYNDIDFCLRVKERGYQNVYLPHVVLYHHESLTRGTPMVNAQTTQRYQQESKRFEETWKKYIEYDPCYNPNFTSQGSGFEINTSR